MTTTPDTAPATTADPARAEHLAVAEQLWQTLYRLATSPVSAYATEKPPTLPGHDQPQFTPYAHVQAALMGALGELTPDCLIAQRVRDALGDADTVAAALTHCGLHPDKLKAYRYNPVEALPYNDTREFVTPADDQLAIVVQIAVCEDRDSGEERLGRATYYLYCTDPHDPLWSLRSYTSVCTEIPADQIPAGITAATATDQDIERLLAALDPAEFTWTGRDPSITPTLRDAWIAAHWPEDIVTRYEQDHDEDD